MVKKIAAILAMLCASNALLSAQGRVNFNNIVSGNAITVFSFGVPPPHRVYPGGDYSVQLRWAAGTFTDVANFEAAIPAASVSVFFFGTTGGSPQTDWAGLFDGGTVAIGPVGLYTMQARGWFNGGGIYPTYNHALNAGQRTGSSSLFNINATAPPTPAPSTTFSSFAILSLSDLPPPTVDIALTNGQAVVSWIPTFQFNLHSTTNLASGEWINIPGPYALVNGRYTVTNTLSDSTRYFRLWR